MPMHTKCKPLNLLGSALVLAGLVTGCSHQPANTYQGYIEGKFVYVASPQSGRLDHLAVARGETAAVKQPLFAFDREPEASAVHNAQRLLESSQSRLADLETGKRPPEIDVTRAQLMQALAQNKTQLVPQIMVSGGNGSSQGGTLVDVLLANLIRDNMKLDSPVSPAPSAEEK